MVTSTVICDPLTKSGCKGFEDRLLECMQTGRLPLKAAAESQTQKLTQQTMKSILTHAKQQTRTSSDAETELPSDAE